MSIIKLKISALPDDGIKGGRFPVWLKEGKARTSGRYASTTYNP